jgi:hypothetical protein
VSRSDPRSLGEQIIGPARILVKGEMSATFSAAPTSVKGFKRDPSKREQCKSPDRPAMEAIESRPTACGSAARSRSSASSKTLVKEDQVQRESGHRPLPPKDRPAPKPRRLGSEPCYRARAASSRARTRKAPANTKS